MKLNLQQKLNHLFALLGKPYNYAEDLLVKLISSLENQFNKKSEKVSLLFVGDLMSDIIQIKQANKGDKYDYSECYKHVKDEINSVDLAIANLEVTHGGEPYTGYYINSTPEEFTHNAIDIGFKILFTANNHCNDQGKKGLERTLQILDERQIYHTGTFYNQEERNKSYPLIVEKNGIKIAFLNYTYNTNNREIEPPNIINYIDKTQIEIDIKKAKNLNPDVIIAIMHWGDEYNNIPNKFQKDLAKWLIKQGVDHIIGSHTHCVQPIKTKYNFKNFKNHLIAYSLGNFLSNAKFEKGRVGATIKFDLEKREGKVNLINPKYAIAWTSPPAYSKKDNFEIYPASFLNKNLTKEEFKFMKKHVSHARMIFSIHNKGVKEYQFNEK